MMVAAALITGASTPAHAEPDVPEGCWAEESTRQDGTVRVVVVCPPGVGNNPDTGSGDDGDGQPVAERECVFHGQPTDCETSAGIWNGTCYVKVADPQPDPDHPVWGGREDGVIIQCTPHEAPALDCDADGNCPNAVFLQWAAGPPDAGPSPLELAQQAVAQMQLTMGTIGSTPPSTTLDSDSLGVVGTPIWLWVDNPAPNTTGPITETAADGDVTVSATATLDRIEWALTTDSGVTVATTTCAGDQAPGTPYDISQGIVASPTCGIPAAQNQRIGSMTITGTAHWVVQWSGGAQTGTITVPGQSDSATIAIGEIQTIITNG